VCCAMLVHLSAIASATATSHPGADFPSSESFYPTAARLWDEEGATVVHYCVDENGRLSEAPIVERSSGDDDLDRAALELAKAGDGHYVPAYEAGKAIASCASFKANFILRDDPSFPVLSHRAKQLTSHSRVRAQLLEKELRQAPRLPDLAAFVPGDQQQLAQLRQFVASVSTLVHEYDVFLSEFIGKMDEVGRADDVSEAERTAFSKSWQDKRAYLEQLKTALLDTRSLLGIANDLAEYVESAQPPLLGPSGANKPTPAQRADTDELIARGRAENAALQTRFTRIANTLAKLGAQVPGIQGSAPDAPTQSPATAPMSLETVASLQYSPASMPNVLPPRQITTSKEIADSCPYPPVANRDYEEGTTVLRVHLDETGTVSAAAVAESSGHDELDTAAVRCIATVRFQPASQNGSPLTSVLRYRWTWKIDWGSPNPKRCDELKAAADARARVPSNSQLGSPAAVVCRCWEESGKAREPQIVESSGSPRLDEGAIKLAKAGGDNPRPPGHPGCFAYRIQFELKD
jgi:TonB family protein